MRLSDEEILAACTSLVQEYAREPALYPSCVRAAAHEGVLQSKGRSETAGHVRFGDVRILFFIKDGQVLIVTSEDMAAAAADEDDARWSN